MHLRITLTLRVALQFLKYKYAAVCCRLNVQNVLAAPVSTGKVHHNRILAGVMAKSKTNDTAAQKHLPHFYRSY